MAEIGIILAEKLIEVIGSEIIKEICDMWGYKSQLDELNNTVSTIKNVLLDADSKRELSQEARGYIAKLKDVVYDADDLFDEFFTLAELKLLDGNKDHKFLKKVNHFFSGKKKEVSQAYRMSRQVKDIKEQLNNIVSNHHKFGLSVDYKPICRRRKETCSYVDAGDIIGREDDKKVVIDMLLSPSNVHESFRFVTIVGVGGLGKTTLAQLVYNDERVVAEFPDSKLRLWVCVSDQNGEQFDVKVILCKILELVSGKRPDDTSSMELVQKQFQEQLRGKKYLLVLDDVWNEDCEKWRSLRTFLMLGQEGSRIVVTTRSEITAKIIGEKHGHKLQGLSLKNSWLLFESVAFDKGEQDQINDPDLVDIGKKIVGKCYGIPLAIKVVGSLLFGQPVNKWQTYEHSGFAGIEKGDNEIMSILKLSYHNLRPSLKSCFSYCALFPKDYRLERKELIGLWMAQGYIVSLDKDQSIEDAAEEHFLILVRRCFFQDVEKDKYGDIGSVKIHDLMHDVAMDVGREETGVLSSNTTKLGDKVRHVYYAGDCPNKFYFKSKIRSFVSRYDHSYNHSITLADTQIDSLMCLRVLCLQRVSDIKRLCDSIGKLLHLRYLDLSWNYRLESLSDSIIGLQNLQTLNLHSCKQLRELPKDFSKLVKLRHLNLSSCEKLTDMPCMDRLTNLWHLNLSKCFELSSMPSGLDKLTSLRHLDLSNCRRLSSMPTSIGQLTSLRHFDLRNCRRLSSMPTSTGQLTSLRHFDLSNCHRLSSIPTSIGQLTSLRHFDLSGCLKLTSMPSGMGKLTNLRVLPLFVVGMEKRVSTDELSMGELKDLKPLTNLKGDFKIKIGKFNMNDGGGEYLKGLKYITEVEILFVDNGDENDGCIEREGVMEKLEPPSNLKELNLLGYKGTIIPRWGRAQDNWALSLPHLVKISLYRCSNLEQIPSLSKLRNLKSLYLDSLYKLKYMEDTRSNNGEDMTAFFPSLESLDIRCLDSFKGWWREEELIEDDHILMFPHLSNLVIMACPKLTSFRSLEDLRLDEVGNSQGDVRLREVEIDDVGLLKAIPSRCLTSLHVTCDEKVQSLSEIGDVFRKYKYTCSLRSLRISYCSNLRRVGTGGLEHLTASLQNLEIIGCPELESRCRYGEDRPKIQRIPNISLREY
ncbi:putative disease resistance protein RGA1 isoform X1 [Chenopodium quinoa]|uniref:putative disease resistance protein RGA1 isoform X1 n=1 Tax=Chenopodium quinoa TaxID=63459 RepID=UPI000B77B6DB|nr:putative disease resistance protein RGA1 isoform X1 [Chenopodium quinoa]XP_021713970.1 putative disease resistance protein RGA1 isoform X1 [Chenopodium quinoa]XP_021713979.1 putative disease resistance protein RGA1 isoform X1 [Chenopodium quinoa]XP_021713984.1 putative disease resistance protein RGA1 isoform X1 [Chenopodium quinoa]